mgnify:CR=1 FL=1
MLFSAGKKTIFLPFVLLTSLVKFEPKVVFSWHLSITFGLEELVDNGMPSPAEKQKIDETGARFDACLKADGNSLFLARITWNGTRQLIYRVYEPETANTFLTNLVENGSEREFAFNMQYDDNWELAQYYLQALHS